MSANTSSRNMVTKGLNVIEQGDALGIDPSQLEATRNFFYSNSFDLKIIGSELHFFFAQGSPFLSNRINMAIEVIFPLNHAIEALYKSIFIEPSTKGTQCFFETLINNNKKASSIIPTATSNYELTELDKFESRVENFRQINANYARFAYALNEGMIEFYEANPILIHSLTSKAKVRQNDGIHSVFAVITSTYMLESFLRKLQGPLKEFHEKFQKEIANAKQ